MTNAPIDPLVIIELTNLKAAGKLEDLAKHPSLAMKPEWMGELAKNKNYTVRRSLAANPAIATVRDIIERLAKDRTVAVRQSQLVIRPEFSGDRTRRYLRAVFAWS